MSGWDDYRLILTIARAGTLRAAANAIGLTHTTVSRRLAVAQERHGALFEQHPDGYRPTQLGVTLIEIAERMESLAHAADRQERAVEGELAGPIKLSLPEPIAQYLLTEDLFEFAADHPAIDLQIETSIRFVDLDRLEADVVVRGAQDPPGHLVGRRLFPTCITYYADRDYLASTPRDHLRWIAPASDGLWPDWRENSPFPEAPVSIVIDDIVTRHRALVKGLGLGRGACFMADPEPNLVRLVPDAPVPQQDLWVLTHPDLRHTPRIRTLMDFITSAMKKKEDLVLGRQRPD